MSSRRDAENSPETECYTDGAARGNPGPSAFAFLVVKGETVLHEGSGYLGTGTNNVAEYEAIIHALEWLSVSGVPVVALYSDSQLVIYQLTGRYRVRKPHLVPLYDTVMNLVERFENITFNVVRREHRYIQQADALCNRVLDTINTTV